LSREERVFEMRELRAVGICLGDQLAVDVKLEMLAVG